MASFRIGLNMAGAVSAGAYTAGVLDFLTEALEAWYRAKARGEAVPAHDVCLEVLSGASAGGMCAAIAAVMLHENFEHVHHPEAKGTGNRLYDSWVNRIDLSELLKTDDLKQNGHVVSLLDSTVIGSIAKNALVPDDVLAVRPYVSANLTIFLSLTNLRGTPYSLNGSAPGSVEESTFFFGDRIRFETLHSGKAAPLAPTAHALDFNKTGAEGGWDVLQTAAMATGAFPVFLAPRVLDRNLAEYTPPLWESVSSAAAGTPPPVKPSFPPGTPDPLQTLNVDGGITNNDPFHFANDYLAQLSPAVHDGKLAGTAVDADRAVISVAPFPTTEAFDVTYLPSSVSGIFSVLGSLFGALISQSRFFGESLDQVMRGTAFNRFVIAPSDPELAERYSKAGRREQPPALQGATLGAFGGFLNRKFRAHDYALGRRNCQKFLLDYFVLPVDNVIMGAALKSMAPTAANATIEKFRRPAPGTYGRSAATLRNEGAPLPSAQTEAAKDWLPLIPLCTDALREPIGPVRREKMTGAELDRVISQIMGRFKAVLSILIGDVPSGALRLFLRVGQPFIRFLARKPLRNALVKQLGDSYERR